MSVEVTKVGGVESNPGSSAAASWVAPPASSAATFGACAVAGTKTCGGSDERTVGTLYRCENGRWIVDQNCATSCQNAFPGGDRCNPFVAEVPAAVLSVLSPRPYVEDKCTPADAPGFEPGAAKRCKYSVLGLDAEVLVIDPPAERVAAWVMDAASYAPPLEALRETDPAAFADGARVIAKHVRLQSSRIFPYQGAIVEDLGPGPKAFAFDRGVVTPCERGNCRCRINSLTPRSYCRWLERGGEDFDACVRKYEGAAGDAAWRDVCAANHARSLTRSYNDHFRAKALVIGRAVEQRCAVKGCSPREVVHALGRELGI